MKKVVSEQVRHKPSFTSTEEGTMLEVLDLDQLCSYFEADLRLWFHICRLLVFSRGGSLVCDVCGYSIGKR